MCELVMKSMDMGLEYEEKEMLEVMRFFFWKCLITGRSPNEEMFSGDINLKK